MRNHTLKQVLLQDAEVVLEASIDYIVDIILLFLLLPSYLCGLPDNLLLDTLSEEGGEPLSDPLIGAGLTLRHLLARRGLHKVKDGLLEFLVVLGLSLFLGFFGFSLLPGLGFGGLGFLPLEQVLHHLAGETGASADFNLLLLVLVALESPKLLSKGDKPSASRGLVAESLFSLPQLNLKLLVEVDEEA